MKDVVQKLIEQKKTISTMESCTGGGVANAITNVEGASEILKFSAVTYSNEFKIKMGVPSDVIDKYSVYSMETAHEMSRQISEFTKSDYGVGVTGKLNRVDVNNPFGADNMVFISIYDRNNEEYWCSTVEAVLGSREENKKLVLTEIENLLMTILTRKKPYQLKK